MPGWHRTPRRRWVGSRMGTTRRSVAILNIHRRRLSSAARNSASQPSACSSNRFEKKRRNRIIRPLGARSRGPEKPTHGLAPNAQAMEMEKMCKINGDRIAEIAFTLHPGDRFTASISL